MPERYFDLTIRTNFVACSRELVGKFQEKSHWPSSTTLSIIEHCDPRRTSRWHVSEGVGKRTLLAVVPAYQRRRSKSTIEHDGLYQQSTTVIKRISPVVEYEVKWSIAEHGLQLHALISTFRTDDSEASPTRS